MNGTNKSVVVDIISDSKKFLKGFEESIKEIEKAAKKADILGSMQDDISSLRQDIFELSKAMSNITVGTDDSAILKMQKKIEALTDKTDQLKSSVKGIELKVDATNGDTLNKQIEIMSSNMQSLIATFKELNSVAHAFRVDSDPNTIKNVDDLIDRYNKALLAYNSFSEAQKKDKQGRWTENFKKASQELYKFGSLIGSIDVESDEIFDEKFVDSIFDVLDKVESITAKEMEKIESDIESLDLAKIINGKFAEVSEYKIKEGKITVPLEVETTVAKLKQQVEDIIVAVQNSMKKVITVPFKLSSAATSKTAFKKELDDLQKGIDLLPDNEVKQTAQSTLNNIKSQFQKVLDLKIKTNVSEVERDINAGIKKIKENLKNAGIVIYAEIELSEKNRKKFQKQLQDIAQVLSIDFGEDISQLKEELENFTDTNSITNWGEKFISIIDQISNRVDKFTGNLKQNNLYETLKGWNDANSILRNNRSTNTGIKTEQGELERYMYLNTDTGLTSNSYIYDQLDTVNIKIINELIKLEGGLQKYNAYIHSHPVDHFEWGKAGFKETGSNLSFSEKDILGYKEHLKKGIDKLMVLSNGKINELDLSSLDEKITDKIIKEYVKTLKTKDNNDPNYYRQFTTGKTVNHDIVSKIDNDLLGSIISKHTKQDPGAFLRQYDIDTLKDISSLSQEVKSLDKISDLLTKISDILLSFNNFTFQIDTSIFDNMVLSLDKINTSLESMIQLIQKINGVSSQLEIDNQFEKVRQKFYEIANIDGSFDGRKTKKIKELMAEYQKYLDMGGSNTFDDLTENEKGRKNLNTAYEKYTKQQIELTKQSERAIQDESISLDKVKQSAEQASFAKDLFSEANKRVNQTAETSTVGISEEVQALEVLSNSRHEAYQDVEKYEEEVIDSTKELLSTYKQAQDAFNSGFSSHSQSYEQMRQAFGSFYSQQGFDTTDIKINLDGVFDFKDASITYYNDELKQTITDTWKLDEANQRFLRTNIRLTDSERQRSNEQQKLIENIEKLRVKSEQAQKNEEKKALQNQNNNINKSLEEKYNKWQNIVSGLNNNTYLAQIQQIEGQFFRLIKSEEEAKKQVENLKTAFASMNQALSMDELISAEQFYHTALSQTQAKLVEVKAEKDKLMSPIKKQNWINTVHDWMTKNTAAAAKFGEQINDILRQMESTNLKEDFEHLITDFQKLKLEAGKTGKTGLSFFDRWKKRLESIVLYLSSFVGFYDIINIGKQGFEIIKEYDKALTEMKKVSDETIRTLKEFQKESYQLADSVGTTAYQLQQSTADWMRLGESLEEAKQSAQEANILFNVSEFESIGEATESLVSMSQAFKDLNKREIIDVVNNLGNNFAISTDGLATALQNSASALTTAKNDFFKAAALTTAANTVVQDPDKVGAGLRTIALRLTGTEAAKKELEELGEDVSDFEVTTTAKMNESIKMLTKTQTQAGVSLLDMNGNYRSTYEILLDIAKVWEEIAQEDLVTGENRQNALLEMMAGKNRSNILASVLQSPEILEEAYSYALDSQGSALRENEAYLESIEGHFNQLKNAWDALWVNENNREVITFFLDLAKAVLENVKEFGVLKTVLLGGGGIFAVIKAFKGEGK